MNIISHEAEFCVIGAGLARKGWQTTTLQWHNVKAEFFADCSGDGILPPLMPKKAYSAHSVRIYSIDIIQKHND